MKNDAEKLRASNASHRRLSEYYARLYEERGDRDRHSAEYYIKNGYHNAVAKLQEQKGRILTLEEKQKEYRLSEHFYYN